MIKNLKAIKEDILKKYKETKKLWNKSLKLYQDFIEKNPGSKQINAPGDMPKIPDEVDTVKGYIDMFEAISDDSLNLQTDFIEKIYLESVRGVTTARKNLWDAQVCVSGTTTAYMATVH